MSAGIFCRRTIGLDDDDHISKLLTALILLILDSSNRLKTELSCVPRELNLVEHVWTSLSSVPRELNLVKHLLKKVNFEIYVADRKATTCI